MSAFHRRYRLLAADWLDVFHVVPVQSFASEVVGDWPIRCGTQKSCGETLHSTMGLQDAQTPRSRWCRRDRPGGSCRPESVFVQFPARPWVGRYWLASGMTGGEPPSLTRDAQCLGRFIRCEPRCLWFSYGIRPSRLCNSSGSSMGLAAEFDLYPRMVRNRAILWVPPRWEARFSPTRGFVVAVWLCVPVLALVKSFCDALDYRLGCAVRRGGGDGDYRVFSFGHSDGMAL